jgi:hypothetical protein
MTMTMIRRWALTAVLVPLLGAATLARGQDAPQPDDAKSGAVRLYDVLVEGKNPDVPLHLDAWTLAIRDPADEALGATLEPAGDSLRAQLGLPTGQGVVVASLVNDGPAARAGLKQNDILLSLADKPLASADDLPKQLKAAGESPVPLKVLRAGKPVTLRVRPIYRVTLGEAGEEKTDYYIGVNASPVDDTLRAHLELPDGRGLVVHEVVAGSPAEKAGVKAHDILLEMGDKAIDSTEALVAAVQNARGKSTRLELLRAGKPSSIQVTPEPRKVEPNPHSEAVRLWRLGAQAHPGMFGRVYTNLPMQSGSGTYTTQLPNLVWHKAPSAETAATQAVTDPSRLAKRLDDLDQELKALRKAVEEIRDALKAGHSKPRD